MNSKIFKVLAVTIPFVAIAGFSAAQDVQKGLATKGITQAETGVQSTSRPNVDHPETSGDAGRPALHKRNPRYQMHFSDVLELTFPYTPEFNQTVTVQPDGYIALRGADSVHVEGKTVPEVTKALETAYAKILHDPVITVELKDFEKPFFIAGGEVGHPGKYDLRGDITVTQAVAIAGGFLPSSKHSQVLLFHKVSEDWVEVKKVNVKKMLRTANVSEDLHVQPGDMLFVPQNAFSKYQRFIPTAGLSTYFGRTAAAY